LLYGIESEVKMKVVDVPKKRMVKCEKEWSYAPLLKKDEEYTLLKSFWYNGEGHCRVRNKEGEVFTAPDVFFHYL
jgi:hypothetical protein